MELDHQRISHTRQTPVRIRHQGVAVGMHRLDLIVDEKTVLELKAVKEIDDAHLATCLSYLKASDLMVGLIINFSEAKTCVRLVIR